MHAYLCNLIFLAIIALKCHLFLDLTYTHPGSMHYCCVIQFYVFERKRSICVMLAPVYWRTEYNFRIVASHSALPSLCPLPSAENTGGETILLPWEVSLRKRGSALVSLTARSGMKNRFLIPKARSWHLGITGARHWHPLSWLARDWDVSEATEVSCCPTGNNILPVPSQSFAHHERCCYTPYLQYSLFF